MSKAKIKFIRAYNVGNTQMIDIVYGPSRVRTCLRDNAPKTALSFIGNASGKRIEWDSIYKRYTIVYE